MIHVELICANPSCRYKLTVYPYVPTKDDLKHLR
jgi:hypothetical protein